MNEDKVKNIVRTYRDLNVYQLSYTLAMKLFELAKRFPKEETYSLTDQVRRASRSIPVNIAEGWTKRKYENVFIRHLIDSNGSCEETKVWLDFARDCAYLDTRGHKDLLERYNEVGAMLNSLIKNWQTF
ncbi:MAG TPA: diversity-generating retroelement protein bAvd family protein [Candidatus Omnitrophica bacterium]|nr:diversity-generating retroelement protein bAvd family protein [Candidatus Omnitrophota bacterium]HCI44237.1 diversity-generating retroelement protein bAvd family protein [Candidatus Omnitrophota bacterium]